MSISSNTSRTLFTDKYGTSYLIEPGKTTYEALEGYKFIRYYQMSSANAVAEFYLPREGNLVVNNTKNESNEAKYSINLGYANFTEVITNTGSNFSNIDGIASGQEHTLFLINGNVYQAGLNNDYVLGFTSADSVDEGSPQWTQRLTHNKDILSNEPAVQVQAGAKTSFILQSDGRVIQMGSNSFGQLGLGESGVRSARHILTNVNNVKQIGQGMYFTVFLLNDGTLKAVGNGELNEFGLPRQNQYYEMQTLTPPGNVIDIATNAYGRHVLYLMDNGDVYGTGYNYYGQLGDGTTTTSEGFKKQNISEPIKQISINYSTSYFLQESGNLYISQKDQNPIQIASDIVFIGGNNYYYDPTLYDLSLSHNTGGKISVNGQQINIPFTKEYVQGTELYLEQTPDNTYKFDGWSDSVQDKNRSITLNSDLSYSQQFQQMYINLTSPSNGNQNVSINGFLNWNHNIENPDQFQVFINGTFVTNTTNTEYEYSDLDFNTKYTWKIKETSTGIESQEYFFYTVKEPDLLITNPNDNEEEVSITPTLSWTSQGVPGVEYTIFLDGYEFQKTTNSSYSVPSDKKLQYHKQYYFYVEFEYNNKIYRSNLINFTTRYADMTGEIYLQFPDNNSTSGTTTSLQWMSSLYPEPVKYELYTNRTGSFLQENVDIIGTYAQLTNLEPTRIDPNNPTGDKIESRISWYVKQIGPNGDTKISDTFSFKVIKQELYGKIYQSFPVYNQMYMDRNITYSWAQDVGLNADTVELNSYDIQYNIYTMRPDNGETEFSLQNGIIKDVTPERSYQPDVEKRFEFQNADPYNPGEKVIWKIEQVYERIDNGALLSESVESQIKPFYVKPEPIEQPLSLISPLNQSTNEHYEIILKWNEPANKHPNNPVEYDIYTDHIGNKLTKVQTLKPDKNWYTKTEYKITNYKKKNKIKWKIIQRDNIGTKIESDVYEFTTLYNKFNLPMSLEYHNIDGNEITIDLNDYLKFDIDKNHTLFTQENPIGLLNENGIYTFTISEQMGNFELQFKVKNSQPIEYSELYRLPIYINKLPKVYNPIIYTINYNEEMKINLKDHIVDNDNDILTYEYIKENQQDDRIVIFYKDNMIIQNQSLGIGSNTFRIRFTDNRIEENSENPIWREQEININVIDNRKAPTLDLKPEYIIDENDTLKINLWKFLNKNE